ncbi:MAG: hypothetical protein JSV19_04425 [Phycisphaerales bacterium]|nr:MAG: hypothetical protein JSV19_04425 [Phycisphaerales bacterium]
MCGIDAKLGLPLIAVLAVMMAAASAPAEEFALAGDNPQFVATSASSTSFALHGNGRGSPPKKAEGNGGPAKPKKPTPPPEPPPVVEPAPAVKPPPVYEPEPIIEPEPVHETTQVATFEQDEGPGCPFSFDIKYHLLSDYVFRGMNLSEYRGEGREKLNHQMTMDMSFDIAQMFGRPKGQYGTFTFGTFFEWYGAQKSLDPIRGGQNLQEVEYILSWAYDIEPIATTFTLGWTFYAFPNAKTKNTNEWFFSLEHNDAWMWKWLLPDNEKGVLNPSFLFAQDVDATGGGCWMELGVHHDFPLFENFTLTPSVIATIDHRYLNPLLETGSGGATRFAYVQYGLTGTYDLTPVLHLPDWAGCVTVSGFLYFNDALGNPEDNGIIQDEFFGGMSVGWSWGG